MPALNEKQIAIASCLAAGMTQHEAAKSGGVSRSTVARWVRGEAFQAEVDRRKKQAERTHQEEADNLQREQIKSFYAQLREYQAARIQTYKGQLARGTRILQRAGRRLDDLPDEAIAPRDIAALLTVADRMIDQGFNGWAEMLAIDKVLESANLDGE